jgi:hypothetical protein
VDDTPRSAGAIETLIVRPVRCDERARWRELMQAHHYLGWGRIVGQSLCYVATVGDQGVALLGGGAAALKCQARDVWIGGTPSLKFRRLHLIANHVRFLILPEGHVPNFASRILALNLQRLSRDWERYYGHPLLLAETFVEGGRFRGTCYRAAGWQALGTTRGFAKRGKGYVAHGQPKWVLVRSLRPGARQSLRAPFLPPATLPGKENTVTMDVKRLPWEGEGGLIELLRTLVDPRHRRGVRHPLGSVVAIAVGAALSGARGFQAVADGGQDLSRDTLQRLGAKRGRAPSEPTLRRVLQKLDAAAGDARIGPWLLEHCDLRGQAVSAEGKTLRRAHDAGPPAPHLLSALLHPERGVVAPRAVGKKPMKSPSSPACSHPSPWKAPWSRPTRCTPSRTRPATWWKEKRPITSSPSKTISPPSSKTSKTSTWKRFPPAHTEIDKGHGRIETRRIWTRTDLGGYSDFPYWAQVFRIERTSTDWRGEHLSIEGAYGLTSLRPRRAGPARLLGLNRGHGSIENGLPYVRDVTFDEDPCRIRQYAGAPVMAALRHLAISLLRRAGATHIAQALRACGRDKQRPLRWLGLAMS